MRLVIKENYDFLCQYVAEYVIDRINKFNPTPEKPFVLGRFSSPVPLNCRTSYWIFSHWCV